MGKVCNSNCPYYGVDENYDGYCKKDHNSYRDRGAACNMEPQTTPAAPAAAPKAASATRNGRVCNSSCPYYGVDENYDGFCKKDHNSYRDRGAACNMEAAPASEAEKKPVPAPTPAPAPKKSAPAVTVEEKKTEAAPAQQVISASADPILRVCGSNCPYYGVDENFNGYCKKDQNSYRDRGATCTMEEMTVPVAASVLPPASKKHGGAAVLIWIVSIAAAVGVVFATLNGGLLQNLFSNADTSALMPTEKEEESSQPTVTVAHTTAEINLREGPSVSSKKILVLPDKAELTVEKTEGEWAYVHYNDKAGWCKREYLKI